MWHAPVDYSADRRDRKIIKLLKPSLSLKHEIELEKLGLGGSLIDIHPRLVILVAFKS
jgi:hypothetical protein